MCCGWSVNSIKTIIDATGTPTYLGFLWDTSEGTVALPKDKTTQVETWSKKLLAAGSTTQEELECFVATLISCMERPAAHQFFSKIAYFLQEKG